MPPRTKRNKRLLRHRKRIPKEAPIVQETPVTPIDISMYGYQEEINYPKYHESPGNNVNPLESLKSLRWKPDVIREEIKDLPRNTYYKIPKEIHHEILNLLLEEGLKFTKWELTLWLSDYLEKDKGYEIIPLETAMETAVRSNNVYALMGLVPYYKPLRDGTAPMWFRPKIMAMYTEGITGALPERNIASCNLDFLIEDRLGWKLPQ